MKNKNLYIAGGVVILLIGALFIFKKPLTAPITEKTADQMTPEEQAVETNRKGVTVQIDEQNNSKQTGIATLEEVNGKVDVTLVLSNIVQGANMPAHIHAGACPTPGAVVYPLTNVTGTTTKTTLNVTLADLMKQMPLAINIHKSASEMKVYTSCGNIPQAGQ